jgi:P27 family predicted phage terminase small subunit
VSGPAPKPTALKRLAGNPGKRPLNEAEPQFAAAAPTCPRHLSHAARTEWHRVVHALVDAGVVTQIDRAVLAAYCQAYGRWVEAERALADGGLTTQTPNGYPVQSVHLQIANKALEQMHRFACELGMTPAARTRVHAEPREKQLSLAELLFQGVTDG